MLQTRSSKEDLAVRLVTLIESLKPYETIEIKLNDNKVGEVSIVVKSNHKEVIRLGNANSV